MDRPKTLGELKASGYQSVGVKEEMRRNLIRKDEFPYTIPSDGPVGQMLNATGRHFWRPAHIHMIVTAPGYQKLTTHIFDEESEYLSTAIPDGDRLYIAGGHGFYALRKRCRGRGNLRDQPRSASERSASPLAGASRLVRVTLPVRPARRSAGRRGR